MKNHLIATLAITLTVALHAPASEEHDHSEKTATGPNGGRLLTSVEPHAEFLVTPERTVQITFVSEEGKPVAAADQIVIFTTGERSAPVKLTFEKSGDVLLSSQPLPEGTNLPAVVQIRQNPAAKTAVEKFHINLAICPGCQKAEYACACKHTH